MHRIVSILLICLSFAHSQAISSSDQTASITKSAVYSVSTDTVHPDVCSACGYFKDDAPIQFQWPFVKFQPVIQTVATLVYLADSSSRITGSTLRYSNATETLVVGKSTTDVVTDVTSFWKSALSLTDVTIVNNIPTVMYTAKIPTAAGAFITITTALVSPHTYYNYGYIVTSIGPGTASTTVTKTDVVPGTTTYMTSGMTRIAPVYRVVNTTLSGTICVTRIIALSASNYQIPLDDRSWYSLVKQNPDVKDCTSTMLDGPGAGTGDKGVSSAATINLVSALTATTTEYDLFQVSQKTAASLSLKLGKATEDIVQSTPTSAVGSLDTESSSPAPTPASIVAVYESTTTAVASTSVISSASPNSWILSTPSPGQSPTLYSNSAGQKSQTISYQSYGPSSVTTNTVTYSHGSGQTQSLISSSGMVSSVGSATTIKSSVTITNGPTMTVISQTTVIRSITHGPDSSGVMSVTENSKLQPASSSTMTSSPDSPLTLIVNGQTFTAVAASSTTMTISNAGYGTLIWVGIGGTTQSSTSDPPSISFQSDVVTPTSAQTSAVVTNLQPVVSNYQGTGARSLGLDCLNPMRFLTSMAILIIAFGL